LTLTQVLIDYAPSGHLDRLLAAAIEILLKAGPVMFMSPLPFGAGFLFLTKGKEE
jgi:hypothetical protein